MQNSPLMQRPVHIHGTPSTRLENKTETRKATINIPSASIVTESRFNIDRTPLTSRLISANEFPEKQNQAEAQSISEKVIQDNTQENQKKILDFVESYVKRKLGNAEKLESFLAEKSINLNDEFFFNHFLNKNFTKLKLSFIKVMVDFNLNLDAKNLIPLINERLDRTHNLIIQEHVSDRLEVLTGRNKLFTEMGWINDYSPYDLIKFLGFHTSSVEIRNKVVDLSINTYQEQIIEIFDQGRKEKKERADSLQKELGKYFPKVLGPVISDYINETAGKELTQAPTAKNIASTSNCCTIL